jgi:hypothetical protein
MSCGWSNSDELRLLDSAFDPTNLPDGIECSDDPLLAFRSAVCRRPARRGRAAR